VSRGSLVGNLATVDSVLFRVTDIEVTARFYEDAFGLRRVWRDKERGMIGLMLAESDAEIVVHHDPHIPSPSFSFLVKDVRRFSEDHVRAGHPVIAEPFEVRSGYFAILGDEDGNEIPIIDLTKFGNQPRYD
jgi:predicted enzyme related to lactoylglutathione lyase